MPADLTPEELEQRIDAGELDPPAEPANCERCGEPATCELRFPAVSDRWATYCDACHQQIAEDCAEVAEHEIDHFGGAYGVPSFEARPIREPESLTPEELDELERLHSEATPGEWRAGRADMTSYHGDGSGPYKAVYVDDPNGEVHHVGGRLPAVVAEAFAGLEGDERCIENAQLIAAMRNALPALLRDARALRRVEALQLELEGLAEPGFGEDQTERQRAFGLVAKKLKRALTSAVEPAGDDHAE